VVVTRTICNIGVGRVIFDRMQTGECKLTLLLQFCGVTKGKTVPWGQIELPVTFSTRDKFRAENIIFDAVR